MTEHFLVDYPSPIRSRALGRQARKLLVRPTNLLGVIGLAIALGAVFGIPVTTLADERTAPTGFTATPGDEQVTLGWDDPRDADITGWSYWIKESGGPAATWHEISGSTATTTSHVVNDLTNYVSYRFRVRAEYAEGSGPPTRPAVEATPAEPDGPADKPAAPTGVSAQAGICEVALSWSDPGDDSIRKWQYRVRQEGEKNRPWENIPGSAAETNSYVVNQLADEKNFYFRVRAVNARGAGMSNRPAVSAKPVYSVEHPYKYPRIQEPLLQRIVIGFECGRLTLVEAAEEAPLSDQGRIAVGVYHDPDNGDAIADYLESHGYAPPYRHRESMEAWVPADLLGPLSEHDDVLAVRVRRGGFPL